MINLFPVSLCSCVSPDLFEWRSMQLKEALPVPSWLHRATLPVSTSASSGSARQQAACVPRTFEARWPEIWGAARHKPQPVHTNVFSVVLHRPLATTGTPLLRMYLSSPSALLRLGRFFFPSCFLPLISTFFSSSARTCSPHARHLCSDPPP